MKNSPECVPLGKTPHTLSWSAFRLLKTFFENVGGSYIYYLLKTENEHIYSVATVTAQLIPTRPIPKHMFLWGTGCVCHDSTPQVNYKSKMISPLSKPCQKHF